MIAKTLAIDCFKSCGLTVLLLICSACDDSKPVQPPQLNWYVFDERSGAFRQAAEFCTRKANGRYAINFTPLPSDADQQREQLVRRLAARDADIDIIGMDVIWTAEFARAGWILPWPDDQVSAIATELLPAAMLSATYADRVWALPFTSNAQLLWYRKDLVATPPATWDELIDMAENTKIQGAIQVQGQRYEGLTVFFVSLLASEGASVLDASGTRVALPVTPTRETLALLKRLANSAAADPGLATAREDQARLAFETGRPVFMVNYSFVWPSAQKNAPEIAENMAWTRWPSVSPDHPSRVTIGGINLAIGAFSRHPALAFEAVSCLTSERNQTLAATQGGMPPTLTNLYQAEAVRARFPMADTLLETLLDAVQRPQTPVYNDVSLAISHTLHPLADIDPDADTRRLRHTVHRALDSEGLF